MQGSTTFTLDVLAPVGVATEFNFVLWTSVLSFSSVGQLAPTAGDVPFVSTAKGTGIEVIDAAGNTVGNLALVGGSGKL